MVNRQLKRIARSYGVSKRVVAVAVAAAVTMGFSSTHEVVTSCEAYAASYAVATNMAKSHRINEEGNGEIYTRIWDERVNEKRKIRTINGKAVRNSHTDELIRSDYGYFVLDYPDVPGSAYLKESTVNLRNTVDVVVTAHTKGGLSYRLRPDQYKQCLAVLNTPTPAYEWYGVVISTEIIEESEDRWPIAHLVKKKLTTLYSRCSSALQLTWLDTTV